MMGKLPVSWCEIFELIYIFLSSDSDVCGGMPSQIMLIGQFSFFFVTMFIALAVAFGFTSAFGGLSNPPDVLRNIPLFVLTSIWPGAYVSVLDTLSIIRNIFDHSSTLLSLTLLSYVVLCVLCERRPLWIYLGAVIAFIIAQIFRLSPVGVSICEVCQTLVVSDCTTPVLYRAPITESMGHLSLLSWRQYRL